MRELKVMGLVSSFQVGRGFGEGKAPACWYLTKPGCVEIADAKDVRTSDLPWVPDSSYRTSKMIAHRLGVNAFFCALAEASRALQGHCLATWRPEHSVRTRASEVKPDGFGRYLHPGGACEFYLEYENVPGAGDWFKCQSAGDRAFGEMPDTRVIFQKGDNFRIPERPRERLRYASDWARYLAAPNGQPKIRYIREPR